MAETDYKKSNKKVINPYTFVPINSGKKDTRNAEDVYAEKSKLLTGVLHCSMYLKTPLAIPDTENGKAEPVNGGEKDDVHMTYPFTRMGNQYMISGSTIRGELRSVYETMTESCFVTLKENTDLSGRVESTSVYKPGILKKEAAGYVLYEAKRHSVPIRNYTEEGKRFEICFSEDGKRKRMIKDSANQKVSTGDEVFFGSRGQKSEVFCLYKDKRPTRDNLKAGILFVGEYIEGKKYESVFEKGKKVTQKENRQPLKQEKLKAAYENWKKTLEKYRNPSINRNLEGDDDIKLHSGYTGYDGLSEEIGIPIWYDVDNLGNIHFSPAAIGRITYNNTLNRLVNRKNVCADRQHLCEACLLFGMISKSGQSIGSRIRVSDAYSSGIPVSSKPKYVTLKELGSPRNSYLPFYARAGKNRVPGSYDESGVEIAGRKFYWHNKRVNLTKSYMAENFGGAEKTKRNATMELLMPDAKGKFIFDVYYDGITREQLKKLEWVISLGENKWDSSMCHKIGHGKPLGLGSVKMVIDENQERVIAEDGYLLKSGNVNINDKDITNTEAVLNLKKVLNFDEPFGSCKGYEIDYPDILNQSDQPYDIQKKQNNNDIARHQWYAANKSGVGGSVKGLPRIDDLDQTIAQFQYIKNAGSSYSAGGKGRNRRSNNGGNRNGQGNSNKGGNKEHKENPSGSKQKTNESRADNRQNFGYSNSNGNFGTSIGDLVGNINLNNSGSRKSSKKKK